MFSTIKRWLHRRRDNVKISPWKFMGVNYAPHVAELEARQLKALQELKEAGKYGPDLPHTQ